MCKLAMLLTILPSAWPPEPRVPPTVGSPGDDALRARPEPAWTAFALPSRPVMSDGERCRVGLRELEEDWLSLGNP